MATIEIQSEELASQLALDGDFVEAILGCAFNYYGDNPDALARWADDVVGGQSVANVAVAKALAKAAGILTE